MSDNSEQQAQQPIAPGNLEVSNSNVNTVRTERTDSIFIVTINRPQVRNAVDGPTAAALARTFRTVSQKGMDGMEV